MPFPRRIVASVAIAASVAALIVSGAVSPAVVKTYSCENLGWWCAADARDAAASADAGTVTGQDIPAVDARLPDIEQRDGPAWEHSALGVIRFHGVVKDAYGLPVEGVEVRSRGSTYVLATTNAKGEFAYDATPRTATVLYLSKEGYRLTTLAIRAPTDLAADEPWQQQVTMAAAGDTYTVDGYVMAQKKLPAGEGRASLQSQRVGTRYEATVGKDGYYRFPAVEAGDDYQLRISATPDLKTVVRGPLVITGPTTLEYSVLEPLRTANLSIAVRDAMGNPMVNRDFDVVIESNERIRQKVTTGFDGTFALEGVPEGSVSLLAHGYPRLEVTGIDFSARQDESIPVTLNVGDRELQGRVLDSTGSPVVGAVVEISGSERRDGTTSRFRFRSSTDGAGGFQFGQLTQGKHELRVRAAEHDPLLVDAEPQDTPITLILHDG